MKNILLGILLFSISVNCISQDLTYGQLHDYIQFDWNKDANGTICCDEFFQIQEAVTAKAFITYDCEPFPGLKDYRQLIDVPKYPDSLDLYEISGRIFVFTLIDTS